MSAHGSKVSHARHERAPLIIAGAIILVIAIAAYSGGGAMLVAPQNPLAKSSEVTNSIGRAFYPLEDGTNCRDVTYNLANGNIISSAIRPCAEGALAEPRRKFIWGR